MAPTRRTRNQMTQAQLHARRADLLTARSQRRLTAIEARELDNLDHRFAMKVWHQAQRDVTQRQRRAGL